MKLIQISVEMVLEDLNLNTCEFVTCVCSHRAAFTPEAVSVGVFLEPWCHSPPNSNNVVDQQLFTNRQEDGTNLITSYSPVSLLSGELFNLSSFYILDSRSTRVDSDSNYEYRVPLKWS